MDGAKGPPDQQLLERCARQVAGIREGVDERLFEALAVGGAAATMPELQAIASELRSLQARWPQVEQLLARLAATGGSSVGAAPASADERWAGSTAAQAASAAEAMQAAATKAAAHGTPLASTSTQAAEPGGGQPGDELLGIVVRLSQSKELHKQGLRLQLYPRTTDPKRPQHHRATQVRVLIKGVLAALITLERPGCPAPTRVAVDAADRYHALDGWEPPNHQVFAKLTGLASQALRHFQLEATAMQLLGSCSPGAWVLEGLLLWLACYSDLFRHPCSASGQLLAWDASTGTMLPPLLRPYRLPRAALTKAANDSSCRQAYHLHAAPPELLPSSSAAGGATARGAGEAGAMQLAQGDATAAVTEAQVAHRLAELFPGAHQAGVLAAGMGISEPALPFPAEPLVLGREAAAGAAQAPHQGSQQQQQQQQVYGVQHGMQMGEFTALLTAETGKQPYS